MQTTFSPAVKKGRILEVVNEYFGLNCLEKTRKHHYVFARHVYIYCLYKFTDMKLREIALTVGLCDHSSCIYARDMIIADCKNNEARRNQVIEIESMIE